MGGRSTAPPRGCGGGRDRSDPRPSGGVGPGRRSCLRPLVAGATGPARATGRRMLEAELRQHGVAREVIAALREEMRGAEESSDTVAIWEGPLDDRDLPQTEVDRARVALRRHLRGRRSPVNLAPASGLACISFGAASIRRRRDRRCRRWGTRRRTAAPTVEPLRLPSGHALRAHDRAAAGAELREILAWRHAPRAGRARGLLPLRPLRQLPGPAGLAHHATPGPPLPAWRARRTTIRLGALVSPVTFRIPGSFAKLVATVDEMSGGRIEVGMGAGWNEREHRELGHRLPVPAASDTTMLEESLAIVHGLWTEPDGWSYDGAHWQVADARFRPADRARPTPSAHHPGRRWRPAPVAPGGAYADELQPSCRPLRKARRGLRHVREACRARRARPRFSSLARR